MRGLCLQGGGAKGAFQVGAMKALNELGYTFDCVVGASVGALNAALYAMGKVDVAEKVWKEIDFSDVLPLDVNRNLGGMGLFAGIAGGVISALRTGGVDTSRIRALLDKYVDENALRTSPVRFGLVTVQVNGTENILRKLFIDDIPQGKVKDFIMASAALPFFKKVEIDGVQYLDGGMMDNLPVDMLVEAGCDSVTAIRLGGDLHYEAKPDEHITVDYVDPSAGVGSLMNFSTESLNRAVKLGYYDTVRHLKGYYGRRFYITDTSVDGIKKLLDGASFYGDACAVIGGGAAADFEGFTALLAGLLGREGAAASEVWQAYCEVMAEYFGVNRWAFYTLTELFGQMLNAANGNAGDLGEGTREARAYALCALMKDRLKV